MSILRSYFNKNNTIQLNSVVNTGRNPITQLYFGGDLATFAPRGFTRFLFDLDLADLRESIANETLSLRNLILAHAFSKTSLIKDG